MCSSCGFPVPLSLSGVSVLEVCGLGGFYKRPAFDFVPVNRYFHHFNNFLSSFL